MPLEIPPTGLPAFEPLLNGSLWSEWVEQGLVFPVRDVAAAVRYLRLKPQVSCRLTLFDPEGEAPPGPPRALYLTLYPDAERAAQAYHKETTRRHVLGNQGYRPFWSEQYSVVGLPFPNDPELPVLRRVYQPKRFRRMLAELHPEHPVDDWRIKKSNLKMQLLAYKPGRRAVFRIAAQWVSRRGGETFREEMNLKVCDATTALRLERLQRVLRGAVPAEAGWSVPRALGRIGEGALFAAEWVPGVALPAVPGGEARGQAYRRTGAALAGLHALDLPMDHLPSSVEEADLALELVADLCRLLPDQHREIEGLGDSVARSAARLVTEPSCVTHGDLHAGQVIVQPEKIFLIDFDRAGRGYAAMDLGAFEAQLIAGGAEPACFRELQRGYAEGGGVVPGRELQDAACGMALLRQASLCFRSLAPDWRARTLQLLRQAADRAGRS